MQTPKQRRARRKRRIRILEALLKNPNESSTKLAQEVKATTGTVLYYKKKLARKEQIKTHVQIQTPLIPTDSAPTDSAPTAQAPAPTTIDTAAPTTVQALTQKEKLARPLKDVADLLSRKTPLSALEGIKVSRLKKAIVSLSRLEAQVLKLTLGIGRKKRRTSKQTAKLLKVSSRTIANAKHRALLKIVARKPFKGLPHFQKETGTNAPLKINPLPMHPLLFKSPTSLENADAQPEPVIEVDWQKQEEEIATTTQEQEENNQRANLSRKIVLAYFNTGSPQKTAEATELPIQTVEQILSEELPFGRRLSVAPPEIQQRIQAPKQAWKAEHQAILLDPSLGFSHKIKTLLSKSYSLEEIEEKLKEIYQSQPESTYNPPIGKPYHPLLNWAPPDPTHPHR